MKALFAFLIFFVSFQPALAEEGSGSWQMNTLYGQLMDMNPVDSTDAFYRSDAELSAFIGIISGMHRKSFWSQFRNKSDPEDFMVDVRWANLDLALVHRERLRNLRTAGLWQFDSIPVDMYGVEKCERYLKYLTPFCLPMAYGEALSGAGDGRELLTGIAAIVTFSEEYLLNAHRASVISLTVEDFLDSFRGIKDRLFYFYITDARKQLAGELGDLELCELLAGIYREGNIAPSSPVLMASLFRLSDSKDLEPFRNIFYKFPIDARSIIWNAAHASALDFVTNDLIGSMDKFGVYDITSMLSDAAEQAYMASAWIAASDVPRGLRNQLLKGMEAHSERLKKWAQFGSFPIGYQEEHWKDFPNGSGSHWLRELDAEGVEMKEIARYSAMVDSVSRELAALDDVANGLDGDAERLQGRLDRFVVNSIDWLEVEIRRIQGHSELAEWGKGMEEELEDIKAALGK